MCRVIECRVIRLYMCRVIGICLCPRLSSVLIEVYVCGQVVEEELALDYTPHVVVTSTMKDVASTAEKLGLRPGTPLSLQALSLSLSQAEKLGLRPGPTHQHTTHGRMWSGWAHVERTAATCCYHRQPPSSTAYDGLAAVAREGSWRSERTG
jgi:hypothetical protein